MPRKEGARRQGWRRSLGPELTARDQWPPSAGADEGVTTIPHSLTEHLLCTGVSSLLPAVPGSAAAPQALATEDSAALQARAANSPAVLYAEIVPLHQPQVGLRR